MFLNRALAFALFLVFYEVSSLSLRSKDKSSEESLESSPSIESSEEFSEGPVEESTTELTSEEPIIALSENELLAYNTLKDLREQLRQLRQPGPAVRGLGDNIMKAIEDLTQRISERIKNFQERADCILKQVNSAQQQATQEVREVGKCIIRAAKKANNDIGPILKDFEREVNRLSGLLSKVVGDLFACRQAERIIPCTVDVVKAAERKFASISASIGDAFEDAGLCWNTLRRDMGQCFANGIGQVTSFDRDLRENILRCLQ